MIITFLSPPYADRTESLIKLTQSYTTTQKQS